MAQNPTPGGGSNQTLLELIYALKGLAQTVEYYHKDLARRLDEEANLRRSEIERLRDIIGKTNQAISVLPITISDRVEHIVDRLENSIDTSMSEINSAVSDVRSKLWEYMKVTERAISQSDGSVEHAEEHSDITGKIEVTNHGDVRLQLNSSVLKRIWYAVAMLASGGGIYGVWKLFKSLFE